MEKNQKDWAIIVDEKERIAIEAKLDQIVNELYENSMNYSNIGIHYGKTGIAIFFLYMYRLTNEEKYSDFALKLLSSVFDSLNSSFKNSTFYFGYSGIGWAFDHLCKKNFIDTDVDEFLGTIDSFLYDMMVKDMDEGNYDFLHGAIGKGLYFLNRETNINSKKYLSYLVDRLEDTAIVGKNGTIKWQAPLPSRNNIMVYNFGLSHGIPSIIVFLAKMIEKGIYTDKSLFLMNGAVKYLLENTISPERYSSFFPNYIFDNELPNKGRLAWCYGDLGIGFSLLHASKASANNELREKALDILLHSTQRRNINEELIDYAGFCHGTSGIAHMYNSIYQETKNTIFKESALFWFRETLKQSKHEDVLTGYKYWNEAGARSSWFNDYGILEGIAGIGLVFISAISDIVPAWDESFLLR